VPRFLLKLGVADVLDDGCSRSGPLSNQSACDRLNAADWASSGTLNQRTARWRVLITKTGMVALTNIYGADTLAQTDCGGFVANNVAAGATTEYECQKNVIQTMTNTATATGDPPSGAPVTSSASSSTAMGPGPVTGDGDFRRHGRCRTVLSALSAGNPGVAHRADHHDPSFAGHVPGNGLGGSAGRAL
jgi:hypothetical protein